jgi:hypothetical protein
MVRPLHDGSRCRTRRQQRAGVAKDPADAATAWLRRGDAMKLPGFLGILMLTATLPAGAGERMTLKVSPAVCFAPANLIVRTMIEADAENRAVEIIAESPDFYRSSKIQLDGERAPRTSVFEFRSLPPGSYDVTARLFGTGGSERAEVHQQVNVIAGGSGY